MKALAVAAGTLAGAAGAAAAGWLVLVRRQGDSHIAFEPEELTGLTSDGRTLRGEVRVVNRGRAGGVVHKVDGRVLEGGTGKVLVTRQGSRPPHRGWWQSNCLLPGEACVAEVDVELEHDPTGPVTVEIDVHEIGRRLLVHRTARLVAAPQPEPAAKPAP